MSERASLRTVVETVPVPLGFYNTRLRMKPSGTVYISCKYIHNYVYVLRRPLTASLGEAYGGCVYIHGMRLANLPNSTTYLLPKIRSTTY